MEFDVTMRIKVDVNTFHLTPNLTDREDIVSETIQDAMYDWDDMKVLEIEVEEVANEY